MQDSAEQREQQTTFYLDSYWRCCGSNEQQTTFHLDSDKRRSSSNGQQTTRKHGAKLSSSASFKS